jgi:hypothetical protein
MNTPEELLKEALAQQSQAQATTKAALTVIEAETEPVEPPPPPPSSGLVVAVDTSGWGGNLHDELTAGGIINRRINNPALVPEIESKGGKVAVVAFHAVPFGSTTGPLAFTPSTFGAELLAAMKAYPNVRRWECLNEPEGAQNPTEAAKIKRYVELLKVSHEAAQQAPSKPLIIASWGPQQGFGKAWATAGGLQYVDEVVVHPYGGSSGQHGGASGDRGAVEVAHTESGKPVAVTEVGWPTATGQSSTGDSQQWSEAAQAANISSFIAWARGYGQVSVVVIFNGVDYDSKDWYGIERPNRSHKPSFAALGTAAKG